VFDGAETPELLQALADATHLIVSIAPDDAGDPVLNAFAGTILGSDAEAPMDRLSVHRRRLR
jgi:hypothetical protein